MLTVPSVSACPFPRFSSCPVSLDKQLEKAVTEWEQLYGTGMAESTLALRFAGVVRRACEQTGQRVAILIDEYDKPMLQAIGNKALQNEFRNTLKPFYGVLKTMDGWPHVAPSARRHA